MLESIFDKVAILQPRNFIKKRLQHRCFPVNDANFLKTPILKNICKRLLLLIVMLLQENNHTQRCFDLPEPKLHKKRTCVMFVHSPQTTFHRKIIYSFVWIYLGRSSRPEAFCEKGVLRNMAKSTREQTIVISSPVKNQPVVVNENLFQKNSLQNLPLVPGKRNYCEVAQ